MKKTNKIIFTIGLPYSLKMSNLHKNNIDNAAIITYDEFSNYLHDEQQKVLNEIEINVKKNNNIIIFGCNSKRRIRSMFIKKIKQVDVYNNYIIDGLFTLLPIDQCLRNLEEARYNPDDIKLLYKVYSSFNIPTVYEGFDHVIIDSCNNNCVSNDDEPKKISKYMKFADTFYQYSPYHKLTLGEHSRKAVFNFKTIFESLQPIIDDDSDLGNKQFICSTLLDVLYLHDLGKVSVRTFHNLDEDEITEYNRNSTATYYSHEFIGAYESLFYEFDNKGQSLDDSRYILLRALLIEIHMLPFTCDISNERIANRFKSKFIKNGNELLNLMNIVHICDMSAK